MLHFDKKSFIVRQFTAALAMLFFVNSVMPTPALAQALAALPVPGTMVQASAPFTPAALKGVKVDLANPFAFDFIVDKGESGLEGQALSDESDRLIKYFLTALTVPEKETWVNLSPYEKNRIIPDALGSTEMGRDMLAQDYVLKQLTATMVYPETDLGKEFWAKVYAEAQAKLGTSDVPMESFNKVWIMPDKIALYETGNGVYIVKHTLKVLTEQDYLAVANNKSDAPEITDEASKTLNDISSRVLREVVLPAITKEVNEGKNFAQLRQVFDSLLLAAWYKVKVKDSILNASFADKNKVAGNALADKTEKEQVYQRYVEAFKKGVYNYIKEDLDAQSNEVIPRKYFSGGVLGDSAKDVNNAERMPASAVPVVSQDRLVGARVDLGNVSAAQAAANASQLFETPEQVAKAITFAEEALKSGKGEDGILGKYGPVSGWGVVAWMGHFRAFLDKIKDKANWEKVRRLKISLNRNGKDKFLEAALRRAQNKEQIGDDELIKTLVASARQDGESNYILDALLKPAEKEALLGRNEYSDIKRIVSNYTRKHQYTAIVASGDAGLGSAIERQTYVLRNHSLEIKKPWFESEGFDYKDIREVLYSNGYLDENGFVRPEFSFSVDGKSLQDKISDKWFVERPSSGKKYTAEQFKKIRNIVLSIGAKGTDIGMLVSSGEIEKVMKLKIKGKDRFLTIAEIKALNLLYRKKMGFLGGGRIVFEPLVNVESKPFYEAFLEKECLQDIIDDRPRVRTYREIFADEGIDINMRMAQFYPSLTVDTLKPTYERLSSVSHGEWATTFLGEMIDSSKKSEGNEFVTFQNGDAVNSLVNDTIMQWMVEEEIPIVMLSTTATDIDTKGGKFGIEITPEGKINVKMLELASAKINDQRSAFVNAGRKGGIGGEGTQSFNTNIAALYKSKLEEILRDVFQNVIQGATLEEKRENMYKIFAPDLIDSKKPQGSKDFFQLEGPFGTALLNLQNYFENTPAAKEILKKHTKSGRLVKIVNIGVEDRMEFFTPGKSAGDYWFQFMTDAFDLDLNDWTLKHVYGAKFHPPLLEFVIPKKDEFDDAPYYKNLTTLEDVALGKNGSAKDLKALQIVLKKGDASDAVILKDAVLIGSIRINNLSGKPQDLNSPESRKELGLPATGRIVLEDVAITFDEQGTMKAGHIDNSEQVVNQVASPVSNRLQQGGIDFDMSNADLNIDSNGPGIKFNIDPAMLQRGDFNGLVPIIRSITPVTDVPAFLGPRVQAPAMAGATG
ncbi:MAG: hypothetical protein WCO69_04685 [Candidatus Omnitrophota bacterium]